MASNSNYDIETDNLLIIETVEEETKEEEPTLRCSQQQRKPVVYFAPTMQGQEHDEVSHLIKQIQ